jgi:hypothetical protein
VELTDEGPVEGFAVEGLVAECPLSWTGAVVKSLLS